MISEELYKQALGSFPAGVTIVSAYDDNGQVTGLTASAFSAVSMSPPLVLVCPNYSSDTYPVLTEGKRFAINILASDQAGPAFAFAKKGEAKVEAIKGVAVSEGQTGVPVIEGAVATIECSLWNEYDGGDHAILVGKVEYIHLDQNSAPLVYCRGQMSAWEEPVTA
ncbi:flavin reductase family protein [Endozoicomonas arenosclerae]|uniref:flavin reductase family protein n=1 Tax=Endozoicomonas arenosclerae TaxID=1633495 RepID=UPI0007815AEF|nr:flavin reductase family protein [Endozoicomonas arenosclerae]